MKRAMLRDDFPTLPTFGFLGPGRPLVGLMVFVSSWVRATTRQWRVIGEFLVRLTG